MTALSAPARRPQIHRRRPGGGAVNKARKHLPWTTTTILVALASGALGLAAAQKSPQPAAPVYTPTEIISGKAVFDKQCEVCHFPHSKAKKIGPGLAKIYPGGKFANGKKVDDASMRLWIEAGGKDMPGFKNALKPEELRDLIAYLHTL
jgi:mono/diheme cytochrome c family protein